MISMNGFSREPQELRSAMAAACERVIDSNWYVLGDEGRRFEAMWAQICGTRHAIGVGNGLDAIEISLRAMEIGVGDEVIASSMTAFATLLGIIRAGATPVLADIEPTTGLMSIDSAERCITSRTRAILLVHLYGQLRDMPRWLALCEAQGIDLVEDCAQAHLAASRGQVAGSFGRVGAYSFYPTKNLGAIGDAGAVVTSDDGIAQHAGRLRNYGQSVRYEHVDLGLNSRMDEIQAAILSTRLAWLEEFTLRRREVAGAYQQGITNPLVRLLADPEEPGSHSYHLYVICCDERDALKSHLLERGIETLIHYPIPMHHQPGAAGLRQDPSGLAVTDMHASTCLSVPCHPQMTSAEVEKVVAAINSFEF